MILMTIGIMIYLIIKASRGAGGRSGTPSEEEETRTIQEIYLGLSKMHKRVEALETLLLEREHERTKQDEFERKMNHE